MKKLLAFSLFLVLAGSAWAQNTIATPVGPLTINGKLVWNPKIIASTWLIDALGNITVPAVVSYPGVTPDGAGGLIITGKITVKEVDTNGPPPTSVVLSGYTIAINPSTGKMTCTAPDGKTS